VHHDHIEELARRADRLAAARTPVAALRAWLETLVAQGSATHDLAASLLAVVDTPAESRCRETIFAVATELVRRTKDSGEIRAGLSAPQLLKLVNAIALASEREPDGPRQAGALLNMVFDGIRV